MTARTTPKEDAGRYQVRVMQRPDPSGPMLGPRTLGGEYYIIWAGCAFFALNLYFPPPSHTGLDYGPSPTLSSASVTPPTAQLFPDSFYFLLSARHVATW